MTNIVRRTAAAVGFAALSLASVASSAARYTFDFQTFFDTSTTLDLLDTKTLPYAVARLNITDINGGVQLTLSQLNNAFPAKTVAGTFIEALWLPGPNGTLKSTSGTALNAGSGYDALQPLVADAGYTYPWNIDFASGQFAENTSSTLTIMGPGVTAAAFATTRTALMLDLANVGGPYAGPQGLNTGVHFIGKLQTVVPEPASYALMGLGLIGIAAAARRRAV